MQHAKFLETPNATRRRSLSGQQEAGCESILGKVGWRQAGVWVPGGFVISYDHSHQSIDIF